MWDIQIAFVLGSEVKRLEIQEESRSLISCREEERTNWLQTWQAALLGVECTSGFVSLNWNGIVQVIITLEKLLSQKQWDLQGS